MPEGQKAGPKGHQLEVGATKLLVVLYYFNKLSDCFYLKVFTHEISNHVNGHDLRILRGSGISKDAGLQAGLYSENLQCTVYGRAEKMVHFKKRRKLKAWSTLLM